MTEHCDEVIEDCSQPYVLRRFLHYARLAPTLKMADLPMDTIAKLRKYVSADLQSWVWTKPEPRLFADFQGGRVRVVMASRFGDVGITSQLTSDHGYEKRVPVDLLSNFSDKA